MELKHSFFSDVKNGRLQKNVSENILLALKCYENRRIQITISKVKSKRTNKQNNLYWLYVQIIADELGYNKDEMSEIVKYKFLKKTKVDENTGLEMEYVGSTTALSKSEFADFTNELIRWCAETFHIVLPLPDENFELILE
jgi:hypothetical protein